MTDQFDAANSIHSKEICSTFSNWKIAIKMDKKMDINMRVRV